MSLQTVLHDLFGDAHRVRIENGLVGGEAEFDGETIAVVGTTDGISIGAETALATARAVLDVVRDHPGRTIVVIVDNGGHRLSRRDELMGNNGFIGHLTKCLDLARRSGHRVIGLLHGVAVSGGFLATGLVTDACYALPGSEVRVMARDAMQRIMRMPEDQLDALLADSPVLGPAAANFVRVGALDGVWSETDLPAQLRAALAATPDAQDRRRQHGAERGGRSEASRVASLVRAGASG
ncbi:MAG: biotin-independent malonate decarboxylase subunit gamma [Rhodospirillales bacterium]|nr:biotin-independent malonate decarboxylase subunit gamma [Rhodospirillales bacterium]